VQLESGPGGGHVSGELKDAAVGAPRSNQVAVGMPACRLGAQSGCVVGPRGVAGRAARSL